MVKILLVEDNELNRDMLARRLERKGYEVALVVAGAAGAAMAQTAMPDLILMDMTFARPGWLDSGPPPQSRCAHQGYPGNRAHG